MKLTAFTDYSLRVLIYLATQPDRRATIAEIASSFEVSEHHLTKVVHFLGKHEWLVNVPGKGGGMSLARTPETIVIGDVVRECAEVQALSVAETADIDAFALLYAGHIEAEEMIAYPAAAALLGDDVRAAIGAQMRQRRGAAG